MTEKLPIELELRKLGLKEKEVRVYLAGLELGPSSVKKIAENAKIARPTTYEIIKTLEKKGLFAEAEQKKKRYFAAQSPERILGILRIQKREIEEKEREFIRIIATLEAKYLKGEIGAYKGREALKTLEENLSFTSSPEIFLLSSRIDQKEIKKREAIYQEIKKRLGKIEVKEIYPKKVISKFPQVQRKILPSLDLKGTLIIFDNAIFLPDKKTPQVIEGFLIENQLIVELLKSVFLSFWNSI